MRRLDAALDEARHEVVPVKRRKDGAIAPAGAVGCDPSRRAPATSEQSGVEPPHSRLA